MYFGTAAQPLDKTGNHNRATKEPNKDGSRSEDITERDHSCQWLLIYQRA